MNLLNFLSITRNSSAACKNLALSTLTGFTLHTSDRAGFGFLWDEIHSLKETELSELISSRRKEIDEQKEHWKNGVSFFEYRGPLISIQKGNGGAYLLLDESRDKYFVVKPVDEDIFCLNNRKRAASPFNDSEHRVCPAIPLYRSAQAEALSYEAACLMDMEAATPKTFMGIMFSADFFDLVDKAAAEREKLCSIQDYLEGTEDLCELVERWIASEISEEEMESLIEQSDFEDLNIFIWTIFDNDGHADNLRAYPIGNGKYGLKKIDNGLAWPEKNSGLFNFLSLLPNGNSPLSEKAKDKIRKIPIAEIIERLHTYEMDACVDAYVERMDLLKQWIEEELSIAQINHRFLELQ